jgi:hypothetical protein
MILCEISYNFYYNYFLKFFSSSALKLGSITIFVFWRCSAILFHLLRKSQFFGRQLAPGNLLVNFAIVQ